MKGLRFHAHAEYNFGKSVTQAGGSVMPVNTALLFDSYADFEAYARHARTLASVAAATRAIDDEVITAAGPESS